MKMLFTDLCSILWFIIDISDNYTYFLYCFKNIITYLWKWNEVTWQWHGPLCAIISLCTIWSV